MSKLNLKFQKILCLIFKVVVVFFQCDATVKCRDKLLHIISHYKPVTLQEIRNYIPVWVKGHRGFLETISQNILTKKKINLQDYISTICTPGVPFYEIGLLLLCRMYHLKLCVFFWKTTIDVLSIDTQLRPMTLLLSSEANYNFRILFEELKS